MKYLAGIIVGAFLFMCSTAWAQPAKVMVDKGGDGFRLKVNGADFVVNGMNWDYFPVGTNYSYSLWNESDYVIMAALDREMTLLRNMGVNTIRQYTGVPARWIKYIYEKYGISTLLNHSFGRYGLTIKGRWEPNTDYARPEVRELLLKEVSELAAAYKDTPGLLMILLGNENNYGLFWRGAETEDIPMEERNSTKGAIPMYRLFNEAAIAIKKIDPSHPVAICNGDLMFLDIIARECKEVDVLGLNVYRGSSFGDLFERVRKEYGKPLFFTEFGSDAFNARTNEEDQAAQADMLVRAWQEIYANAAGMGGSGNALGGFTFQFSDGWWKFGQTTNLNIHDANASWSNAAYPFDFEQGEDNMNEEWFGICAKGLPNEMNLYDLYPRAAYYALKTLHQFNPYTSNRQALDAAANLSVTDATLRARADKAALDAGSNKALYLSDLQATFTTFNTGGSLITTPKAKNPTGTSYPSSLGFDHMQSFNIGVTAQPAPNLTANVQLNVLGNVAENPIDEVFYENRGRFINVITPTGTQQIRPGNRVQLYRSSFQWNHKLFNLTGFYRTGHYHWAYEGDFFNLYQEANYGPNIDIYNGEAPFGVEVEAKKSLKGLKLAFGPELWWGANPAVLLKYQRQVMRWDVAGIFHEDITQRSGLQSSFAVPVPKTRRVSLSLGRKWNHFSVNLGGLWAGQPLNGRNFQLVRGEGTDAQVYVDEIRSSDNFGGKIKFTASAGSFNWYGMGSAMGLVANGGFDQTRTITGWRLKDVGSGNMYNVLSGFAIQMGTWQIAPNFLWQKPIEGPLPSNLGAPARPRNILDDPFSVRSNRETVGGELLISFDPTPGTWMYDWDNDRTEDAPLAMSLDFVYRHLPTTQDAAIGILANGRTTFVFPGAAPAQDLWEANARVVSRLNSITGVIFNAFFGNGQANGSDTRTITRYGADIRAIHKKHKLSAFARFNDWGPFDYHRDFNLTFPMQLMADITTDLGKPDWFLLPGTKMGLRITYRTLDRYSPRYAPVYTVDAAGNVVPDPLAIGFPNGNEWEFRTYFQVNIGR